MQRFIIEKIKQISGEHIISDEEKILNIIFKEKVRVDPANELTLAEMLIKKKMESSGEVLTYDANIRRYGLRRYVSQDTEVLAIDTDSQEIRKILRNTPFSEYKEILQRHPAVMEKSKPVYMAGKNTRCIIFDWKKLENLYFCEEIDDDIPF